MFRVEGGPDRGHASVPAPPLSMVAGSVKAATCTLTSATATPAPVSDINFYFLSLVRFYTLHIFIYRTSICLPCNVPALVVYLFSFSVFDIFLTSFLSVSGNWGPWSSWGSCSKTCNGGQMRRYRTCDNPRPANGGRACAGADTQIQRCSTANCPGESACLKLCQGSTKLRVEGLLHVQKMLLKRKIKWL